MTFRSVARSAIFALLGCLGALSQTTGNITIAGSIPHAVSITSASDATLSTTVTLGALTPTNTSSLTQSAPVVVRVRSNQQYRLSASATFTNSGAGSDAGGSAISAADIGFGIIGRDASGSLVAAGHTDTITPKFDYTSIGFTSLPVTDGLTPFVPGTNGTLADILTGTQMLQGSRISRKGNINTQENFLKVTFGAATLPQYFSPTTGFQAVITLTVVTF
jgi:hypothetical protein